MSTRTKRFVMLALATACLVASGLLVEPLRRVQVRHDLTNAPVKGVSPGVVLATTALGAFRGIIVDVVWIRMEALKNDGKFFEIVQLADLACRLAPNFPKVWDFNAWNMAYNVSVLIPDFSERWLWVKRGIALLRDHGIPNNPTVPELYFSLGWTYLHKIAHHQDDAQYVYKEGLGLEMHDALGEGGSREELERFVKAPRTSEALLQDRRVQEFYERCVAEGFDLLAEIPDEGISRFFIWVRNPESIPAGARELMEGEANKYAVEQIADYARAKRLREQLRLDAGKMIELMDKFGPFDWRSPYPHAIYWATEGMRAAHKYRRQFESRPNRREEQAPDDPSSITGAPAHEYHDVNYDRVVYASLMFLVTRGRLTYDSRGRLLPMESPDYRFTDAMIEHFDRLAEKYKDRDEEGYLQGVFAGGFSDAYSNFLKQVIVEFFYRGDEKLSRSYFERLKLKHPKPEYLVPFEEFVDREVKAYLREMYPSDCRTLVRALLFRHYFCLGAADDETASVYHNKAKKTINLWHEQRGGEERDSQRVDFTAIGETVLMDIFSGRAGFPGEVRERLEQRLSVTLVEKVKKAVETQKQGVVDIKTLRDAQELDDLLHRYKAPVPE